MAIDQIFLANCGCCATTAPCIVCPPDESMSPIARLEWPAGWVQQFSCRNCVPLDEIGFVYAYHFIPGTYCRWLTDLVCPDDVLDLRCEGGGFPIWYSLAASLTLGGDGAGGIFLRADYFAQGLLNDGGVPDCGGASGQQYSIRYEKTIGPELVTSCRGHFTLPFATVNSPVGYSGCVLSPIPPTVGVWL